MPAFSSAQTFSAAAACGTTAGTCTIQAPLLPPKCATTSCGAAACVRAVVSSISRLLAPLDLATRRPTSNHLPSSSRRLRVLTDMAQVPAVPPRTPSVHLLKSAQTSRAADACAATADSCTTLPQARLVTRLPPSHLHSISDPPPITSAAAYMAASSSSYGGYASSSASLPDAPVCKDFQNGRSVARRPAFAPPFSVPAKAPFVCRCRCVRGAQCRYKHEMLDAVSAYCPPAQMSYMPSAYAEAVDLTPVPVEPENSPKCLPLKCTILLPVTGVHTLTTFETSGFEIRMLADIVAV